MMQRILILGCAGAGKTVLARRVAEVLDLPVVHLDRHYWLPGWGVPGGPDWADRVLRLVDEPKWAMDGNYVGTLPLRLAAADTVIHLDLATWRCMWRVGRRTLTWLGRTRPDDMAPGCRERFDLAFARYILRYRRDHRPRVMKALADFSGRTFVLDSPREVERFLARVRIGDAAV